MAVVVEGPVFPAKLLLFGEHVLLLGADALAVPVPQWGGRWSWSEQSNRHLARMRSFAASENLRTVQGLDAQRFAEELERGLCFDSNIPTGYGLGSSGALCAAVYDRYVGQKTDDLAELKRIFGQMESFFHGNSSGIDPLTSYAGHPLLIQRKNQVAAVTPKRWGTGAPQVFLSDTKLPRRTGPLVAWFLEQSEKSEFRSLLEEGYLPAHHDALHGWLNADPDLFWPAIQKVSEYQFQHFAPLVPETSKRLWEEGLFGGRYYLKICGAGGGGYVLGFAKDAQTARQLGDSCPVGQAP